MGRRPSWAGPIKASWRRTQHSPHDAAVFTDYGWDCIPASWLACGYAAAKVKPVLRMYELSLRGAVVKTTPLHVRRWSGTPPHPSNGAASNPSRPGRLPGSDLLVFDRRGKIKSIQPTGFVS